MLKGDDGEQWISYFLWQFNKVLDIAGMKDAALLRFIKGGLTRSFFCFGAFRDNSQGFVCITEGRVHQWNISRTTLNQLCPQLEYNKIISKSKCQLEVQGNSAFKSIFPSLEILPELLTPYQITDTLECFISFCLSKYSTVSFKVPHL